MPDALSMNCPLTIRRTSTASWLTQLWSPPLSMRQKMRKWSWWAAAGPRRSVGTCWARSARVCSTTRTVQSPSFMTPAFGRTRDSQRGADPRGHRRLAGLRRGHGADVRRSFISRCAINCAARLERCRRLSPSWAWIGEFTATKATRSSVNGWPDGRNGTRTCRCTDDWSATCRPAGSSTSPRTPNWWWSAVAAAEATPACSWVR